MAEKVVVEVRAETEAGAEEVVDKREEVIDEVEVARNKEERERRRQSRR